MIRTQLYLPKKLHSALALTALRRHESVAAVVRQILQDGLEQDRKKCVHSTHALLKMTGKCTAKTPGDLSHNITSYLYGAKSPNYGS
ncbi:MAG: hypothetical protein UW24_C0013G0006 [Parcubacteria group bacterium GW2011_GWA2_44_12]|nr:MAG: hypothetical protein UW24_C0013G0006 [Parcubacteria group bacterium GW2011_GWA2_44_12]